MKGEPCRERRVGWLAFGPWVPWLLACSPSLAPPAPPEVVLPEGPVRLATVLPTEGEEGAIGRAVETALRAGLSQRADAIELVVVPRDADPWSALDQLAPQPVALVAPAPGPQLEALIAWSARSKIPVIGPFAPSPPEDDLPSAPVYYLYSGPLQQVRALVQHTPEGRPTALVGGDPARSRAFDRQVQVLGLAGRKVDAAHSCRALQADGVGSALLALPGPEARSWFEQASADGCSLELRFEGDLLQPLFGLQGGLPYAGPLYSSSSTRAGDVKPSAVAAFEAELKAIGARPEHLTVQLAARAALALTLEALDQASARQPAPIEAALLGLQGFSTGLTPPLSYGPLRRVGALGAWVVARDPLTGRALPEPAEQFVVPAR